MVALAFCEKGVGCDTVDHIDGNTKNNVASNLEWITQAEQNRRAHALNASRKSSAPKQSKPILGKKAGSDDEWVRYDSACDAARKLSLDKDNLSQCLKGKLRTCGGYVWKYAPVAPDLPNEVWKDLTDEVLRRQRMIASGEMDEIESVMESMITSLELQFEAAA